MPPESPLPVDERGAELVRRIEQASAMLVDEMKDEREERAEERVASARRRRRRARRPLQLAVVACFIGAALTLANVSGRGPFRLEPPTMDDDERGRYVLMHAGLVLAYLDEWGELPTGLVDIDMPTDGSWTYRAVGAREFVLCREFGDAVVTHDSRLGEAHVSIGLPGGLE